MKAHPAKIFFLLVILPVCLFAQANGKDFGLSLNLNYTTTSQLYLQPNSPDPVIRNTSQSLDKISSYSAELRYQYSESILFGISSEYIKKTFDNTMNLGGTAAKVTDGYKVIPVELSIYYQLPFSTELFKFFMGGGMGFYIGEQIREVGDVTVSNSSRKIGYGIQVSVGMDYLVNSFIAIRGQMRFREPDFEMRSTYSNKIVNYDDRTFLLPTQSFDSKVIIDGITFTIGAVLNFGL